MQNISKKMGIDGVGLGRILDFLPYPVLVSEFREGEQHNIFVNKAFTEEVGYSCEEIPTISAWFINAYPDTDYRNSVIAGWNEQVLEAKTLGRDFVTKQAQIKTKLFGEKWFEVKASLYGSINLVAFVNIDDEIRREQSLSLLNENKDRILAILSHDLRSPLVTLHSVLRLISNNSLTESERSEMLTRLTRQVFQMTEFVDTTLQWTRTNFSEQKPVYQVVNLSNLIENTLNLYHDSLEAKRLMVRAVIDLKTSPTGDPEIFSILLRNLLSNAIKFSLVGSKIILSAIKRNETLVIEIENSGPAISQEKINGILRRQYQPGRGTQGEKGLGLGLKLCLQLLDSVQGKMEIETPSPDRTLFRVVLPS